MTPRKPKRNLCGAPTRRGLPCTNPAGHGTEHPRFGKCRVHDELTNTNVGGAPLGNDNAVTTGEYETLHVSTLTPAERLMYSGVGPSPTAQAENSVRLCCIREHRILLRINAAIAAEASSDNGLTVTAVSHLQGHQPKGSVNTQQVDRGPALATIMALEDSLTRVQALKLRAVAILRECLKDTTEEGNPLDALVEAINRNAKRFVEEDEAARDADE